MDPFLPAWRLAEMTRSGEIGCLELLEFYLDRVERLDGQLNAVVVRDIDRARGRAKALDNSADRTAPLFGVPMTVKESYDLRGHPTTWGFAHLKAHRAGQDALAVRRLEASGAIVFGKTNVPVGLGDWQSFNPIYGATNNPWDVARTPGGSSGGAAAALAAGFGALEMGSDIGGSIRVPAHFCGVFGHKPSWGLVSPRGHSTSDAAAMTDISVVGPLARSARDLALAMSIVAGPDPDDTEMRYALPSPRTIGAVGLRVAVWSHQPGQTTSRETTALIEHAAAHLAGLGARVDDKARPAIDPIEAYHLYLMLLDAALSSRLPAAAIDKRRARQAALRDDDVSADAVMLRATDISHGTWLALNERRTRMRRVWSQFFREWDVLLCPVTAGPAFLHRHEGDMLSMRPLPIDDSDMPYAEQLFWPGVTGGFHLPATIAPLGLSGDGLPTGVQIAGPYFGDLTTLAVARLLEESWRHFEPPPGFAVEP